jgi:general secretion pathway protein D
MKFAPTLLALSVALLIQPLRAQTPAADPFTIGGRASTPAPGATPATSAPQAQPLTGDVVISVTPSPAGTAAAAAAKVPPAASASAESPPAPMAQGVQMIRGDDKVIAAPKASAPLAGGAAGLKFENAPLGDVVHVIMREVAKVNYLIHPPITGAVTLSTQGNVSADDAVFLLENALLANGFVMAQDARGTYHIGRPDVVRNVVPAVRQAIKSNPMPPGHGAIIIPLKYIGAAEMAAILKPMAPGESIVRIDTVRNLLVMTGNRSQAEGWLDIVSTFDVDMLKGMSVAVIPLKYITTKEVQLALQIFSPGGGAALAASAASGNAAPAPAAAGTQPPQAVARNPANPTGALAGAGAAAGGASMSPSFPLFGALRVVPLERLNSVLVVTPRAAYIDEAKAWLDKIDRPGASASEPQLFVFPVQNGSAAHLANVLSGLFGSGTPQNPATPNSGVAPALAQGAGVLGGNAAGGGGAGAALNPNAGRSNVQGAGITTVNFASGLRVMADGINNAVLIYGTAAEYAKVEATLKRLDVPPSQVLIEASIVEVTLNDDLQYGLQWAFSEQKDGGIGRGVLSRAAGAALGSTPAGFSYTWATSTGDVRAVLNALADKSLVKVISSPSLMVMDNHTASIAVGTQQPVQSGQTVTTGGNISSNIQYKDTGVNLSVTPSVNSGNMVSMQLNQSVTDVGSIDAATGQRSFLQRQIGSKVAVRSGETIVLGGLIRDNSTVGRTGIPFLSDIPILGNLFGTSSKNSGRTELLVMITPRVVRSDQEIKDLANDVRERMKGLLPGKLFPTAPVDWTPDLNALKAPAKAAER